MKVASHHFSALNILRSMSGGSMLFRVLLGLATLHGSAAIVFAQQPQNEVRGVESSGSKIRWRTIAEGYSIARVTLSTSNYLISSELLVIAIDPKRYSFALVRAADFGKKTLDVRAMTINADGFIGINTHFFDPQGDPLGLLVRRGTQEHRLQRGGSVLTGVFYLDSGVPRIVHRRDYAPAKTPQLAIQAGPRLIEAGKSVPLKTEETASRRSGIAITENGQVLLFATFLRFPGASLQQIQKFLLRPELKVRDALNLDGGGSSQLFVVSNPAIEGDIFISGGDPIPVGLVVKNR